MSQSPRQTREFPSPQHDVREKAAAEAEERKKKTKTVKEWVEVVKRIPSEDGKVILKSMTNNGYTHSWYVGRESKCKDWLAEQQKAGKYVPYRSR
jgi:hypothetical protein